MAHFCFHGFTLKTAMRNELHWRLAESWTEADPDHRETTPAGFWFEQNENCYSYILEDRHGVVFFFKMMWHGTDQVELHIQFPPAPEEAEATADQRQRTIRGLTEGIPWIERVLAIRNVSTLFFTSKSPSLIRFCVKRLGFRHEEGRLTKAIEVVQGLAKSATV